MTLNRRKLKAFGVAALVNAVCAVIFWVLLTAAGGAHFFSFWNRSPLGRGALTAAFLVIGARVLVWYVRKVWGYKLQRGRSLLRLAPLGFGLGVFAMTLCWLFVAFVYSAIARSIRLIQGNELLDLTIILVPFAFFVQLLFSRSTLIWLLEGGVIWLLVAYVPELREALLGFRVTEADPEPARTTSLSFVKTWNVFGYLILILSLMFQG